MNKNDFADVSRRSLMELCMFDVYGITDKIGVCKFIEEMDISSLLKLTDKIVHSKNDAEPKIILEIEYYNSLKEKNPNISILNENKWLEDRDKILMEDEKTPQITGGAMTSDSLIRVFESGGVAALSSLVVYGYAIKPILMNRALVNLKLKQLDIYRDLVLYMKQHNIPILSKLPGMGKTNRELKKLRDTLYTLKKKEATTTDDDKILTQSHRDVKSAFKKDLKPIIDYWTAKDEKGNSIIKQKIKTFGKRSALISLSITAAYIAINMLIQRFFTEAAKACKGQKSYKNKSICIYNHKISACNIGINKWKEFLQGCSEKTNPEKCKHGAQTAIWNLEIRKRKYQKKLEQLVKSSAKNTIPEKKTSDDSGVFKSRG